MHSIERHKSKITCKMLQDTARSHTTVLTRVSLLKTWNLKWSTYAGTWAAEQARWYSQAPNTQRSISRQQNSHRSAALSIHQAATGWKSEILSHATGTNPKREETERFYGWNCVIFLCWKEDRGVLFLEKIHNFIFHAKSHLGQRIKHLFYSLF